MAGQQADRLGQVHARAAAKRDDAVRAGILVARGDVNRLVFGRIGHRVGENAARLTADRLDDRVQNPRSLDAGICNDEGLADAIAPQHARQLLDRAMVEDAGVQEVHYGHGGPRLGLLVCHSVGWQGGGKQA